MKHLLLEKFIKFDTLLGLVALVIALVAAFFSVYGIATLFAGAFISTAIMASVLEIGKVVTVTYLYRFWKQTRRWLAFYLSVALVILMVITSGGIFGYLSAAYEKSSTNYKAQQDQIVMVEKTKVFSQNKIEQAQKRVELLNEMRKSQEARLSEALNNQMISRNAFTLKQLQDQTAEMVKTTEADIKAEQAKMDTAMKEIQDTDKKVNEMKFSDTGKDIRTFEFVAKLFNTTLDNVAKWFIFLLIVVFDPLAIALILAYNVVTYKQEEAPVALPAPVEQPVEILQPEPEPVVVEKPVEEPEMDPNKVWKPKSITFSNKRVPPIPEPEAPTPPEPAPQAPLDNFMAAYFKM